MTTEGEIAQAYLNGIRAADQNKALHENPYYGRPDSTRVLPEYDAWRSGWIDRINQLKKRPPNE